MSELIDKVKVNGRENHISKDGEWETMKHRGTGSTFVRAQEIDGIYDAAAPIPGRGGNENASQLIASITATVQTAVSEAGGRFQ